MLLLILHMETQIERKRRAEARELWLAHQREQRASGQKVSKRPSDIEMMGALSLQRAVEDLDETSSLQSAIANSMLDHGSDRMSDRMSDNMSDDGSAFEDATSSHLSGSEIEEDELRQALEQSLASAAQDGGANLSHSSASRKAFPFPRRDNMVRCDWRSHRCVGFPGTNGGELTLLLHILFVVVVVVYLLISY